MDHIVNSITIKVPATTANIGPGYDIWGLSLPLYNIFHVHFLCDTSSHKKEGVYFSFSDSIQKLSLSLKPEDSDPIDNLFMTGYQALFNVYKQDYIPISVDSQVNIPFKRGLGSSATAIIGGLLAAHFILEKQYNIDITFSTLECLAIQIEGHPDNVSPCLYGGFVVSMCKNREKNASEIKYLSQELKIEAPLKLAGIIPQSISSTKESRLVIPQTVPLSILTFHTARTAIIPHLLQKKEWKDKDYELFSVAMQDCVHQKQRSFLIYFMLDTFDLWYKMGCLAPFLSGSGTTLLGFWRKTETINFDNLAKYLPNGERDYIPLEFTDLHNPARPHISSF